MLCGCRRHEWIAARDWQGHCSGEFLYMLSMNDRSRRQAFTWMYVDLHRHNAHVAT